MYLAYFRSLHTSFISLKNVFLREKSIRKCKIDSNSLLKKKKKERIGFYLAKESEAENFVEGREDRDEVREERKGRGVSNYKRAL